MSDIQVSLLLDKPKLFYFLL